MVKAWTVIQHRGYKDFRYGSFNVYVTEEDVTIRGMLKKGNQSLYMTIKKIFDD